MTRDSIVFHNRFSLNWFLFCFSIMNDSSISMDLCVYDFTNNIRPTIKGLVMYVVCFGFILLCYFWMIIRKRFQVIDSPICDTDLWKLWKKISKENLSIWKLIGFVGPKVTKYVYGFTHHILLLVTHFLLVGAFFHHPSITSLLEIF